jgi:hypothetical protein
MNFYAPTESFIFTLSCNLIMLINRKPWRHGGRGRKRMFVNKIEEAEYMHGSDADLNYSM